MKQTYKIKGMTCNSCRSVVEEKLGAIKGVKNTIVNLEKEEAIIQMDNPIDQNTLQNALPLKYTISEKQEDKNHFDETDSNSSHIALQTEKSKFQQLQPLFIILGYISVASILINYKQATWSEVLLDFMGLFFIVFSFFKILDLKGFPDSFRMYDPLAKIIPTYAWLYPFLETVLGLMFLMRFEIPIALVVTLMVLGITTIGVTKTLVKKKSIQCACLGTALRLPMTEATFIENAIMIVMAIYMLIKYVS